ncbi:sugar-binding transcriptional regulator [Psychromicrobium xiongbiense]|uniref:sugar-binding transcriptional regulator n=1 Tax=Psychromicrobium xiongbiense TaxID=3051184 RepID=UPI002555B097|nr:sugar-binding domain-containing protein [Psychromicrobium sp. YIM S02556]
MGPDELVKMAYVAKRYYVSDVSQSEIAEEIGESRFKVARMLKRAKSLGIVRFEFDTDGLIDSDLSVALQHRFGLRRAIVAVTPGDSDDAIRDYVGRAAAQLLQEIVEPGDVIGLTSGRTVQATVQALTSLPRCDVVALGGVAGQRPQDGVEIVRQAQRAAGGRVWPIFAPLVLHDASAARALLQDPVIRETTRQFPRVTKGVVAVGNWSPPNSQFYDATKELGISESLMAEGVLGDVAATLFSADGTIITTLDERTVAIRADELRKVPEVIAVGGGASKAKAMRAAIEARLFTSLVTDVSLAETLLALPPVGRAALS